MKEKQVRAVFPPSASGSPEDSMGTVTKQLQSLANTETLGY